MIERAREGDDFAHEQVRCSFLDHVFLLGQSQGLLFSFWCRGYPVILQIPLTVICGIIEDMVFTLLVQGMGVQNIC